MIRRQGAAPAARRERRTTCPESGGSSGIGEAAARLLAADGAHVALADVQEELGQQVAESVRAAGGEALFVRCDVTADGEVDSAIDKGAGVARPARLRVQQRWRPICGAATASYPEDDWERIMAINLKGIWRCMVRELAEMSDRGGGAIVNMSSVAGVAGFPRITGRPNRQLPPRHLTQRPIEFSARTRRASARAARQGSWTFPPR